MMQPASGHGFTSLLRRREWWPLAAILAATVLVYARSLNSPLYSDDYFYLTAARELSFGEYARAAFTPWGNEPLLPFTRDFWRPLAFLWFELAEPWFGGNPTPYHLANLAVHLVSVVLVWLLAKRLDARLAVRSVAVAVFALYPGSFEAVTWISSFNSAGLPFALGAWLVFLGGTAGKDVRWPFVALSAALVGVGLMFRESATALLPAMGLWYLLVQRREQTGEWRTYLPFAPFVVVGIAYYLVRSRFLNEPLANPDIYALDDEYAERLWYYVQNAPLPFRDGATGWRDIAQDAAGVALLCLPPAALFRRRWDLLALSLGLLLSMLPLGATLLGVGQRYLYFSTPVLAVCGGILAADALHALCGRLASGTEARTAPTDHGYGGAPAVNVALAGLLAVVVIGFGASSWSRIGHWDAIGPRAQQEWVEALRAEHPELPEGGILYCSNVPLVLAIFDGVILGPTVRWYYGGDHKVIHYRGPEPPLLGPRDRWFANAKGR